MAFFRPVHVKVVLLYGTLFFSNMAWANPDAQLKSAQGPKLTAASKNFRLDAYDLSWKALPIGYLGTNAEKAHAKLNLDRKGITRREFETTAEFAQRKAATDAEVPAPFKPDEYYAFKIDVGSWKYNADSQEFRLLTSGTDSCKTPTQTVGWVLCPIKSVYANRETYTATNSFGAKTTVMKKNEIFFGLSISAASLVKFSDVFSSVNSIGESTYSVSFPLEIEKAKSLASKKIGVLLVGRMLGAESASVMNFATEPTISSPYDVSIMTMGPRFDLKRTVIYVVETGEILKQNDAGT